MYIPLLTRSAYSLLTSTIRLNDYVAKAKTLGYTHLGLCDVENVHGLIEFQQLCQQAAITPIFGVSLAYDSAVMEKTYHVHVFAHDHKSYLSLLTLSSQAMIENTLTALHDVWVVLPEENEWFDLLQANRDPQTALVGPNFARDQVFAAVTPTTKDHQAYLAFIRAQQLRPLAVEELASLTTNQALTLEVLKQIKSGDKLEATQLAHIKQQTSSALLSPHEMDERFAFYPEALATHKVFEQIEFYVSLSQSHLPKYPLPQGQTAKEQLKELCIKGLAFRQVETRSDYQERLTYELSVIHEMGFDDYFLIVWDVMDFAHRQQIVTGAGRGSAAGSLVAYLLRITEVDPLEYELLFERFLNPERFSLPDIDLDIPDNHREEILQYVKERYGQDYVAQIATFGTMAAKMALRDVGRVFGLSQSEANRWSRALPSRVKITLTEGYHESKQFRELVESNERNQLIYQVACAIEGLPRHVSTHAAGVVIGDRNLWGIVPLQLGNNGIYLTQWTMYAVEAVGLLKMDFLGLRNLSIIDETLKGIAYLTGETFTQEKIPLNDAKTYHLFQQGETAGIFQFESSGIKQVLRKLGPENLEDLAAVNALYRPGPMQMIDTFIARKKGKETIQYPDEVLAPILRPTYGVMVYQEQIMQVAAKLAGYTLGQADLLRRAIGKKNHQLLEAERENFINKALAKQVTKETATVVYDYIARFADYGFNRSHAFAYSIIGYQMAYLKTHYPVAFFKAILHSVQHQPKKINEYLTEAKRYHVTIYPPSINESFTSFQFAGKDGIRFGLTSIKGMRRDFAQAIITERQQNGPFASFDAFLLRMQTEAKRFLKEENLRPLIQVGVFDALLPNRHQAVEELNGRLQNLEFSAGSLEMLQLMPLKGTPVAEYSESERLAFEEAYLGLYLSGHPLDRYQKLYKPFQLQMIADVAVGQQVKILGYVNSMREIRTKKGEKMAFLDVMDATKELSLTVFPELYRQKRAILAEEMAYIFEGKLERSQFNQQLQLIVRKIELADEWIASLDQKTCFLRITNENDTPTRLAELAHVLQSVHGKTPVIMYYEAKKQQKMLEESFWLDPTPQALAKIGALLGNENVVFN